MIDCSQICLISPIEQNKTVLCWDGKYHRRYFEMEAVKMVKSWRKNAGYLKDIDIIFFNTNGAKISSKTILELEKNQCDIITASDISDYYDIGFLTEPLCGKLAEDILDSNKKILIKIDLDMQIVKPIDKELLKLALNNVLIEEYTDYVKKGQRLQIGDNNPLDTCFMISNRESFFYNSYYQYCQKGEALESEEWKRIYNDSGYYFIEEFVADYMQLHKLGPQPILNMCGHIFGEGYKPLSLMNDDEIKKLNFLHSHIYLNEGPLDDEWDENKTKMEYMKRNLFISRRII